MLQFTGRKARICFCLFDGHEAFCLSLSCAIRPLNNGVERPSDFSEVSVSLPAVANADPRAKQAEAQE